MAKSKNKVYLVEEAPGKYRSFDNWPACQAFVQGRPIAFAGGATREAAMQKLNATRDWQLSGGPKKKSSSKPKVPGGPLPTEGLTSDAGTHGNPGPCEYQVTDLKGKILEHRHLGVHTNNYAELAGIEAMVRIAGERGESVCWTDSTIAMGWIRSGRLGPTVREPELIKGLIHRINALQAEYPNVTLKKWNTREWGQIPSDFGRK